MLLENPKGNYSFVSGRGVPFSSGAIAEPGFAIVHASFAPLVRLSDGYGAIERHLHAVGRPLNAVCGIELSIPTAFTPQEFEQFNRAYLERIAAWGVLIDRLNSIARTNLTPGVPALAEPSLYGFFYTVPPSEFHVVRLCWLDRPRWPPAMTEGERSSLLATFRLTRSAARPSAYSTI